jgi:hypothetical protein
VLVLTGDMSLKFLTATFSFSPAKRPIWSLKSGNYCGKFFCEGLLKKNRPVWSPLTRLVDAVEAQNHSYNLKGNGDIDFIRLRRRPRLLAVDECEKDNPSNPHVQEGMLRRDSAEER